MTNSLRTVIDLDPTDRAKIEAMLKQGKSVDLVARYTGFPHQQILPIAARMPTFSGEYRPRSSGDDAIQDSEAVRFRSRAALSSEQLRDACLRLAARG